MLCSTPIVRPVDHNPLAKSLRAPCARRCQWSTRCWPRITNAHHYAITKWVTLSPTHVGSDPNVAQHVTSSSRVPFAVHALYARSHVCPLALSGMTSAYRNSSVSSMPVVFVNRAALQLGPRSSDRSSVMPRCRLPACSDIGFNHNMVGSFLVYDVNQCVGVMHYEIEPQLLFHLAAKLECLISPCYRIYPHRAMRMLTLPTAGIDHVRWRAVGKVFPKRMFLHEHPAVYRHARIHVEHTEDLVTKIKLTRLRHINASERLERFL